MSYFRNLVGTSSDEHFGFASYGGGLFTPLGVPFPQSRQSRDWLAEDAAAAQNRLEMREKILFKKKLQIKEQYGNLVSPPPLYNFGQEPGKAFMDFDEDDYFSHTGMPGKRMIRSIDRVTPSAAACRVGESEGVCPNVQEQPKIYVPSLQQQASREGREVYRSTCQDLPANTPAVVLQKIDSDMEHTLRPGYILEGPDDTTLVFESRFESGNLHTATQVSEFEYDLALRHDTNTSGHTQWYYFSISNTHAGRVYRFNLTNLVKNDSLYNSGLRPLLYSSRTSSMEGGVGWHRSGSDIRYFANGMRGRGGPTYTLTFSITAEHSNDTLFLAHCYPYTYRDLQVYLHGIQMDPVKRHLVRRRSLCETEAGNKCDVLTVTEQSSAESSRGEPKRSRGEPKSSRGEPCDKRIVIISARVHPGETQASWMMQGIIDFLTSDCEQAAELRKMFVFKLIPMLNPDGVINGNYRCCLSGQDLNRSWTKPHPVKHSTIYSTKMMIDHLQRHEQREVALFLDLHGHSKKKNVFIYGSDPKILHTRFPSTFCGIEEGYEAMSERLFPFLMSERVPFFSYQQCSFDIQRVKLSTGRVVCAREFDITNSYTLEASFCGSSDTKLHFDIPTLVSIGRDVCLALLSRFKASPAEVTAMIQKLQEAHELARRGAADAPGEDDGAGADEDVDSSSGDEDGAGEGAHAPAGDLGQDVGCAETGQDRTEVEVRVQEGETPEADDKAPRQNQDGGTEHVVETHVPEEKSPRHVPEEKSPRHVPEEKLQRMLARGDVPTLRCPSSEEVMPEKQQDTREPLHEGFARARSTELAGVGGSKARVGGKTARKVTLGRADGQAPAAAKATKHKPPLQEVEMGGCMLDHQEGGSRGRLLSEQVPGQWQHKASPASHVGRPVHPHALARRRSSVNQPAIEVMDLTMNLQAAMGENPAPATSPAKSHTLSSASPKMSFNLPAGAPPLNSLSHEGTSGDQLAHIIERLAFENGKSQALMPWPAAMAGSGRSIPATVSFSRRDFLTKRNHSFSRLRSLPDPKEGPNSELMNGGAVESEVYGGLRRHSSLQSIKSVVGGSTLVSLLLNRRVAGVAKDQLRAQHLHLAAAAEARADHVHALDAAVLRSRAITVSAADPQAQQMHDLHAEQSEAKGTFRGLTPRGQGPKTPAGFFARLTSHTQSTNHKAGSGRTPPSLLLHKPSTKSGAKSMFKVVSDSPS